MVDLIGLLCALLKPLGNNNKIVVVIFFIVVCLVLMLFLCWFSCSFVKVSSLLCDRNNYDVTIMEMNANQSWKLECFSGKIVWVAFNVIQNDILEKSNLTCFIYTCLSGVRTFPLLVAIIPFSGDGLCYCVSVEK